MKKIYKIILYLILFAITLAGTMYWVTINKEQNVQEDEKIEKLKYIEISYCRDSEITNPKYKIDYEGKIYKDLETEEYVEKLKQQNHKKLEEYIINLYENSTTTYKTNYKIYTDKFEIYCRYVEIKEMSDIMQFKLEFVE